MSGHAKLNASSSARWIACPGSVRLIDSLPHGVAERTSRPACEGSAAHGLAEWCLHECKPPEEFPAEFLKVPKWDEPFPKDAEMCEAVQVYLDTIGDELARLGDGTEAWIEARVRPFNYRDDMWGTADCIIMQPFGELQVWDYKHGKGVVVEPEYNSQAMFYGLGALRALGLIAEDVTKVTLGIVQPRARHAEGGVRRWVTDRRELEEFGDVLEAAADRTKDADAPLVAGDHCRFCPARGACPAQRADALGHFDIPVAMPESVGPPPVPAHHPAEIARLMKIIPRWDEFVRAVEGVAMRLAERGEHLPGFKLVRRRANRRWQDKKLVVQQLQERVSGLDAVDLFTMPELKSPAQVEKVLTARKIKKKDRDALMAELAEKPDGGLTLADEGDARPAVEVAPAVDLLPTGD